MPCSVSPLFYLGVSHKTASVRLLERLSVDQQDHDELIRLLFSRLRDLHPDAEVVVLGTCNRLEIYWTEGSVAELYQGLGQEEPEDFRKRRHAGRGAGSAIEGGPADSRTLIQNLVADFAGVDSAELDSRLEHLSGRAAVEHLFRVASGAESLVIGEHQILGQVEEALSIANRSGTVGSGLGTVFTGAIRCGRRCRLETPIGRNARDVSSVAVALAERLVGDLTERRVLVAGMGEMGRLTVKALHHRGVGEVEIVNRGIERAREIAERWGAIVKPMSEIRSLLGEADIMITSTASRSPILTAGEIESVMMTRPNRPLVLIDLAVPRDIEPSAGKVGGVHLFDLDGLKEVALKGEQERRMAIPAVEKIIGEELGTVRADLGDRAVRPVLSGLWNQAESIRSEVIRNARTHLAGFTPDQLEVVDRMTRTLTNKLLHSPSVRLRSETTNDRAIEYAAILTELFGLQSEGSTGRKSANDP